LAGAGLGLQLHDLLRGTDHHGVFERWWSGTCRTKYLHLDGDELPQRSTLYYDPILDVHHEVPVAFGMIPAIYLAPQVPDEARRLFRAGMTQQGLWETTEPITAPAPRGSALNLWLAREWDLHWLAEPLAAAIDDTSEPTWDTARGEFTWGFQLEDAHPRGQYNGTMAAAQVARSRSWWRLANVGSGTRFDEPTVVDVDFPAVALRQAEWDAASSTLTVTPVGIGTTENAQRTSFRITNIGDPTRWAPHGPAGVDAQLRPSGADLEVDVPVRGEALQLRGPAA
jgi:hypothetical protein